MMKESQKEQFKWKFWFLAVILNGIIFLFAVAVLSWFLIPDPYRSPITVISIIIGAFLILYFRKRYKTTKEWLSQCSDEKEQG